MGKLIEKFKGFLNNNEPVVRIEDKKKKNIDNIREVAENYYRDGDYYCSEAIVKAFIEEFDLKLDDSAVGMASAFPVGIGGKGCTCGALTGATMMIGYFYGRREKGSKQVEKSMELSAKLYDEFVKNNKSTCCRVLTSGMKKGSKKHMDQCVRLTGEMAYKSAQIILDEM
ncbi:MAG: C-GCAxxG-C-C family (seleno)protein [Halanaerobiales bacterium]|nr:C-GCAxxG-C-C family (seleno)protein [Halanaerobiales bacterium]